MSTSGQRLDLVIFGATGFTGIYAVQEVLRLSRDKGGLSWGVAGRNEGKLRDVLKRIAQKTGEDLNKVEVIIADIAREESLLNMAAKAKVVVNCVGPYRHYGEPVVKACIERGAHHVDITGEPLFMETMQLKYHKAAEEKGVYVVSACGVDSIPADMGTVFLQENFEGTVNSVETYLKIWRETSSIKVPEIHYGTWESAVHIMGDYAELKPLRQKLFPNKLPTLEPRLKQRLLHRNSAVRGWCIPFPGPDRSVVLRSQRHFFEKEKQRPVQMKTYSALRSLIEVIALTVFAALFGVLAYFEIGRALLLKYPRLFTGGVVSHEGPSEASAEDTLFAMTLYGEGWTEKLADPTDQFATPVNKTMAVKVSGRNPAYGATTVMLVMSAFVILTEAAKLPSRGGVYPPGAAFAKTSMIQQLNERGVKFEVISTS